MVEIDDRLIRAYALKNAVEHGGRAVPGSVLSPLFNEGLEKSEVKGVMGNINSIVKEVNKMTQAEQKKGFEAVEELISRRSEREGLQELPNAVHGKVVTRFAPSPSGPAHIGHAATGMPSSLYAKQYGGKFIVRIEDTNPENIFTPAYEMLKDECDWVFGNVTKYIIQSDRLKLYYKYAEEFIEKGYAYICECDPEVFRELVKKKRECPCRSLNEKEQMKRWKKMFDKKGYKQGDAVVRFKSDLTHPNPALRDFPLVRINDEEHPRQGKKYRVWPLMNLSVFVDDVETGVTHSIRAKEHQDNGLRQEMMAAALGKTPPETIFMGRYNFTDLPISASKTKAAIASGDYHGWDDIRLPFLASMKRRGFLPEAFREMAIQRGVSAVDKKITKKDYFELLANFNRELIREEAVEVEYGNEKTEKTGEVIMRMPTGEIKPYYVEGDFEDGKIYFFKNVGYAKYNGDLKELWFTHS